jgi:hypothetical protein
MSGGENVKIKKRYHYLEPPPGHWWGTWVWVRTQREATRLRARSGKEPVPAPFSWRKFHLNVLHSFAIILSRPIKIKLDISRALGFHFILEDISALYPCINW